MKNFLFFIKSATISSLIFAHTPQGLKYQSTVYNKEGIAVCQKKLQLKLSILDGAANGTTVYEEIQKAVTDNDGNFSIMIGNGSVLYGTFNVINWANGLKWLKTEIDIKGNGNYTILEHSKFLDQLPLLGIKNK